MFVGHLNDPTLLAAVAIGNVWAMVTMLIPYGTANQNEWLSPARNRSLLLLLTCHSLALLSFIRFLVCAGQLGYPGIRSWQPRASWCSVDAINGDCCDSVHPSGGHLVVCRGHSRCTAPEPSDRKAGRPLRASAVALHDPLHTLLGPHQVAAGTGEWGAVWVWCGL